MSGSTLVLGTAQLTRPYGLGAPGRAPTFEEAVALLRQAAPWVAAVDTAPAYGAAEAAVGEAALQVPVFTKLDPGIELRASLDRSLDRLRRTMVDVLFLHEPSVVVDDPDGVIERAVSLVGHGAGRLGASVYRPDEVSAGLDDPRISALQVPLSIADRRLLDAGLLDEAAAAGTALYARSALLQGALLLPTGSLPPHLRPLGAVLDAVQACARDQERSATSVLLAYVRDLPGVAGVVVGVDSLAQLHEVVAALAAPPLPAHWRERIDDLPALPEPVLDPRRWP